MKYESTDWSLEVQEGWICERNEDCTTFCHPNGVGAFQLSSFRKDDLATDEDLHEFAEDIPLVAVSTGGFTGFRTQFSEDDSFWIKWWLRAGRQMVLVTYNCSLADRGREGAEVSAMIHSLAPRNVANPAEN